MAQKIYVIAGEASGDLHGSNLIHALRAACSEPLEIYGVGGDKIRETGALNFYDLAHFHVTGVTEALRRLPRYFSASRKILEDIQAASPDLVVLIDNPGFNLHLAEKIHSLKIPIVYYIAPQVWAWAPKRIRKIKKFIKKVLVVFEFEKKIYQDHGIPVVWVGHPLKDLIKAEGGGRRAEEKKDPKILLLPGSRKGEIQYLLDTFLKAAALIRKKIPGASFHLLKSSALQRAFYDRVLQNSPVKVTLEDAKPYELMKQSDLAIACSGTATLELALVGTPMIIANKSSLVTWLLAKSLIRVHYLGLPNLVLNREAFPELMQFHMTPERLSEEALDILSSENRRRKMKEDLREVAGSLGEAGAAGRAAGEVLKILENR